MSLQPVDTLKIQVLVDNVTDNLSSIPEMVMHEVTHLRKKGMTELSGECLCCGAHGLSLLLTASYGDSRHTVLFDAGPEGEVFARNVARLNVDLGIVDDMVLSHGHWDHAGGFIKALELIKKQKPEKQVTFHSNPGMFHQRAVQSPHNNQIHAFKKIPSQDELEQSGAAVVNSDEPRFLQKMFYLSGEIPRVTDYEKGYPEHVRQVADAEWAPDPWIMDERFLAVNVRGKGLIVFSACSHAGIINVLKHTQKLFPNTPLYAVMGGLHLAGSSVEKIIPQTVADLKQFNLQKIIPAHCTGWRAVSALASTFGDNIVIPSAVGRTYTF